MCVHEAAPTRILVVDDNPANAHLLEVVLAGDGHQVALATDGREALDAVACAPPDLILLDLDMPRLNGYEVCRHIKQDPRTRLIPTVIVTGHGEVATKIRAWELGADDFITKPFQCVEVLARCRSLLRLKKLIEELDSAEEVVFAFARVVEAKNPYTMGHSQRVANYALALARAVGVPENEFEKLSKGALLHDIGKIHTPDAILNKPAALTPEEYDIVKQHTVQGAHMVEPLRSIRSVIPMIRWHHERLDGQGYPDGLAGSEIPLLVRLLSVADVYDSLASRRPYRDAIRPEMCVSIMIQSANEGGLDPELVSVFCDRVLGDETALARMPQNETACISLQG